MACGTCGGKTPDPTVYVVTRSDNSTFEVQSETEAKIQIAMGTGTKYVAKAKK
jgi:hypothetical protein